MWPDNTVIYDYSDEVERSSRAMSSFQSAMKKWSDVTYVKFVRRTDQTKGYVEFRLKDNVCQASIGYYASSVSNISIDEADCGAPEIIHELGHTLGVWHEQTRPDRDGYIEILLDNVTDREAHNFDVQSESLTTYGNTDYDRRSIMHYGGCAFAKDLDGDLDAAALRGV